MLDADHPREACGVFGVWAPGEPVANLAFYGLYALQHRGQESAGIAVADGYSLLVRKEMGLVSQVFDEPTLATLQGHLAIGHTRHCWTGGSCWATAQPAFNTNAAGGGIALAHDGNLTTTAGRAGHLMPRESPPGWPDQAHAGSDTDVIAELLAREAALPLEEAIVRTMPRPGALTATAASAGIGPVRGPRAAGSRRAIRCRCRTLRSPTSGRPPPPSRRPVRCRTPSEVAR